jgi:hypothetical protein
VVLAQEIACTAIRDVQRLAGRRDRRDARGPPQRLEIRLVGVCVARACPGATDDPPPELAVLRDQLEVELVRRECRRQRIQERIEDLVRTLGAQRERRDGTERVERQVRGGVETDRRDPDIVTDRSRLTPG